VFAVLLFINYSEIQALEIGHVFLKPSVISNLYVATLGKKLDGCSRGHLFPVLLFINYSEIQSLEIGHVFLKPSEISNLQAATLGIKP
jgi:hypothetical protein